MKETASNYIGETVTDAVITVPAYFTSKQKKATQKAGQIAGLNVLRLITEPAAAAVAYGLQKNTGKKIKNVFVFDFGGGTFDVSILKIENHHHKVVATNGDTELGGIDFDERLLKFAIEDFKKINKKDMSQNKHAVFRLKEACEEAKVILSNEYEAYIDLAYLHEDKHYRTTITRAHFNELTKDLIARLMTPMEEALGDAKMTKDDIHDVLMVGGSSRIVKVQQFVRDFFNGKEMTKGINPEDAVAYGASALAAHLQYGDDVCDLTKGLQLQEVVPLSLGVAVESGLISICLKRNTPIPVKVTKGFETVYDNQDSVLCEVLEGERAKAEDNCLLDEFLIEDLPLRPKGEVKLDVTFEIDVNGILTVSERERSTGKMNKVTVRKDHFTGASIDRMLEEAEKFKEDDKKEKKRILAKVELEEYAYATKSKFDADKKRIDKIQQAVTWIHENPTAPEENIREKLEKLQTNCDGYL